MMTESKPRTAGTILLIDEGDIFANPDQPRKYFDPTELQGLAQSIRINGILQPISVRKRSNGYEVIAGERRLRAARLAGLQRLPCIIISADDEKTALFALIENLQRKDLSFFEEAAAIDSLIKEHGLSADEAAKYLGKAQSTLSNKLRLLKLPQDIRDSITQANLTERHARALLKISDEEKQRCALNTIIKKGLNVSQSEKLINSMTENEARRKPKVIKLFKDVRIFVNTLNHAVDTMREAGIAAESKKTETDEFIEYTVKIPKAQKCEITSSRQSAV